MVQMVQELRTHSYQRKVCEMITSALTVGFAYSFAYVLIGGLAYGIALKISSSGLSLWRSVAGFVLALVVGWFGGALISAYLFGIVTPITAKDAFLPLIGRGFWLALFGAGYGVYKSRKALRPHNPPEQVGVHIQAGIAKLPLRGMPERNKNCEDSAFNEESRLTAGPSLR
jgi:zinc transporter ZupT